MMIHVHSDLTLVQQERLVEEIRIFEGVTAVGFNLLIMHWMFVIFDIDKITAMNILCRVRQWDKNAVYF